MPPPRRPLIGATPPRPPRPPKAARARLRLALVPLLIAAAGCPDRSISAVTPDPHSVERKDIPVAPRALDLLFIVDDSGSMAAEQKSLQQNFPKFIERISAIEGGLPDIHIGVISTDVGAPASVGCSATGDDGDLLTRSCAGLASGATFLSDLSTDTGRTRNYTGALADVFSCMADLGTKGCGAEQPLESLRKALDPSNAHNAGFLRPDSVLAVILITDEDDCSTRDRGMFTRSNLTTDKLIFGCTEFGITCDEPVTTEGVKHNCAPLKSSPYMFDVDEYAQFLHKLRPHDETLVLGAITGETTCVQIGHPTQDASNQRDTTAPLLLPTHACALAAKGTATPPVRLAAFREQFTNSAFVPIGDGDLTGALDDVAHMLANTLGNWCLEGDLADKNLQVEGLQPDCVVTDVRHPGAVDEHQEVLAQCSASAGPPCWRVEPDADRCASFPSGLRLTIDRGATPVEPDTRVHAECVVN
jgi:hypothetical protein